MAQPGQHITSVPADFDLDILPDGPNEALVTAARRRRSRVLLVVYTEDASGWSVSSPDLARLADSTPSLEELRRRVGARLAEWLADQVEVREVIRAWSGRFSGADC